MLAFVTVLSLLVLASASSAQTREDDYLRQDSARFRVVYCPEDAGVVKGLWTTLRTQVPRVEMQLGLRLADSVRFVITPTEREWFRITAGAPLWANGIAYPERGVAVLKSPRFGQPYGPLPVTAIHEYVHLLLAAAAPQARFPRWFDEGLAQVLAGQLDYMDTPILGRAVIAGRLHSLRQLEWLMSMPDGEARLGYAESAVAVEFLRQRFGMSGISNLVHEVRKGRPFEEAFATVLGLSLVTFEGEHRAHVQSDYRFAFLSDLELWLSAAIVILIFAAGVGVWLRRRRVLQRWREEEGREIGTADPSAPPFVVNYELVRSRLHEKDDDTPPDENLRTDRPGGH